MVILVAVLGGFGVGFRSFLMVLVLGSGSNIIILSLTLWFYCWLLLVQMVVGVSGSRWLWKVPGSRKWFSKDHLLLPSVNPP